MLNEVYKIVQTLLVKEQDGYLTPAEFNNLAQQAQEEIFREYFDQYNRDETRAERGLIDRGLGNMPAQVREKIEYLATSTTLSESSGVYTLPSDLYYILSDGVRLSSNGRIVEEVKRSASPYVALMTDYTESNANSTYPFYKRTSSTQITTNATGLGDLTFDYIKVPAAPKWTYNTVSGNPVFNISAGDYQDFELHPSELPELVIRIMGYFGINLDKTELLQISQNQQAAEYSKNNQ